MNANRMSGPDNFLPSDTAEVTTEQLQYATELGLELEDAADIRVVVQRIEQHLGQDSLLELARWFLFSIMQHLQKAKWESLDDSGVPKEKQHQLAAEFIASDEYKHSLLVVLKDPRYKFALLRFAKGRNPAKRILSSTTKAYRRGREILIEHGLVDARTAKKRARKLGQQSETDGNTIASRRAARRAANSDPDLIPPAQGSSGSTEKTGSEMSEEEFAELDKLLGSEQAQSGKPWTYQSNEERFSLLLGALTGGAVFIVSLWLFF